MKEIYSPYSEKLKKQEKDNQIDKLKSFGKVAFYSALIAGGVLLVADHKDEIVDVMAKAKSVAYESMANSLEANEISISPENLIDSEIYTIHEGDTLSNLSWKELESLSDKNGIDANKEFNGSAVNLQINQAQLKSADRNGNLHPGDSFEMKIGKDKNSNDYQMTIDPVN